MLAFVFRHPLIFGLGLALIVLGGYLAWRKHSMILRGHLTEGEVVQLIPHRGSKGGVSYSLRVAYTAPDGAHGEFTTSYSSSPPLHALNEKVRVVCYDSGTPDILAFQDDFLFPLICISIGAGILLVCSGFIFGPSLIEAYYVPRLSPPDASRAFLR